MIIQNNWKWLEAWKNKQYSFFQIKYVLIHSVILYLDYHLLIPLLLFNQKNQKKIKSPFKFFYSKVNKALFNCSL